MLDSIRVSVKAVIIQDGKILMIENHFREGLFYDLPGGGQNFGETLPEALERECREELGAKVLVKDILHVHDFISQNHEITRQMKPQHCVKIEFACELLSEVDYETKGDDYQTAIVWLPLDKLHEYPVHPSSLYQVLNTNTKYIGEVF